MIKKLLIFTGVAVVVLLGVAWWLLAGRGEKPYTAVYLQTGDIYFGKMSWFPWPRLKEVWFLQRTVGAENQPQLGVAPFKTVFWGPTDEVRLNPKQIIWWTTLREDSELLKGIRSVGK